LSQYKWVVDDDTVSRKLDDRHSLEITLMEKGIEMRVWEEPEDKRDKRKLMYHKHISHGQLGYFIPEED